MQVSYVLFDEIPNYPNYSSDTLKLTLQNKNLNGYFSATQASNFVEKFEVVAHQPNTPNGFSATLFKDKETGEYYYATRGTEDNVDRIDADALDIGLDGLAIHQIVDMYNDWQRLKAPKDSIYQAAELLMLPNETGWLRDELRTNWPKVCGPYMQGLLARTDIIIDMPSETVYTINIGNSDDILGYSHRAYGLDKISGSENVTAVGHSLGGHLAAAFSHLFPDECSDALTINGAGFMTENAGGLIPHATTDICNLFSMLGGSDHFNSSGILNLYGDKGWEMTSMDSKYGLVQQGGHQEIYIESTAGFSWSSVLGTTIGHGASQMTDSLAVYDLFARLDEKYKTYTFKQFFDELNPVFNAMEPGRDSYDTYENIVNVFGDLFVDGYSHISRSQWNGNREDLYKAIDRIHENTKETKVNITTITDMSASAIESQANANNDRGLAFRFSLVNLIPFAITGSPGLYDRINTGGKLDIHTSENTDGDLTEHYIEDRSMFLYHLMNPEAALSGGSGNIFL